MHLLAARKTRNYAGKTDQYIECGMEPIGDAWIRYSAVYYLYALVFVETVKGIRVISFRKANKREVRRYEQATQP